MLIETSGGFDFTGAGCAGWMKEAGFRETRIEHLVGPHSMVRGTKYHSGCVKLKSCPITAHAGRSCLRMPGFAINAASRNTTTREPKSRSRCKPLRRRRHPFPLPPRDHRKSASGIGSRCGSASRSGYWPWCLYRRPRRCFRQSHSWDSSARDWWRRYGIRGEPDSGFRCAAARESAG